MQWYICCWKEKVSNSLSVLHKVSWTVVFLLTAIAEFVTCLVDNVGCLNVQVEGLKLRSKQAKYFPKGLVSVLHFSYHLTLPWLNTTLPYTCWRDLSIIHLKSQFWFCVHQHRSCCALWNVCVELCHSCVDEISWTVVLLVWWNLKAQMKHWRHHIIL